LYIFESNKDTYCHHLTLPCRVSVTTMADDICGPWYCCHDYVWYDMGDIM